MNDQAQSNQAKCNILFKELRNHKDITHDSIGNAQVFKVEESVTFLGNFNLLGN